jgi:DNA-binding transcriptional ArsR family regulator
LFKDYQMPTRLQSLRPLLAARVADLLSVFGDANRVRLLWLLTQGEINVTHLAEATGMSVSAVSHHLRQLRHRRLVSVRKTGRQVYYAVDDEHIIALLQQVVSHARHA